MILENLGEQHLRIINVIFKKIQMEAKTECSDSKCKICNKEPPYTPAELKCLPEVMN